jgi:hypothetical protein
VVIPWWPIWLTLDRAMRLESILGRSIVLGGASLFEIVAHVCEVLAAMNLISFAAALVFVFIASMMLIHRIIWGIDGRPLEVLAAGHILLKRWPLFLAGVGALGASSTEAIRYVIKALH